MSAGDFLSWKIEGRHFLKVHQQRFENIWEQISLSAVRMMKLGVEDLSYVRIILNKWGLVIFSLEKLRVDNLQSYFDINLKRIDSKCPTVELEGWNYV